MKCSTCARSLGPVGLITGRSSCDDCKHELAQREQELAAQRSAARTQYAAMLGEYTSADVVTIDTARRSEIGQVAQTLSADDRRQLQREAFGTWASRLLADDILSVEEEATWNDVTELLDLPMTVLIDEFSEVWHRLIIARINDGRLPVTEAPSVLTKRNEVVHAEFPASLLKEVAVREYQAGHQGVSFRVMKGVRFHTGGTRGRSVVVGSQFRVEDAGTLSITSQRLVFTGEKKAMEMPYSKMLDFDGYSDGVRIHLSNRQNSPLFQIEKGELAVAVLNGAVQKALDSA